MAVDSASQACVSAEPSIRDLQSLDKPPMKRRRTGWVSPSSQLHCSNIPSSPRVSAELPAQRRHVLQDIPSLFFRSPALPESFFLPHLGQGGFLVPRVASSAHMNELVAKYSGHLSDPTLDMPYCGGPLDCTLSPSHPELVAGSCVPDPENFMDHGLEPGGAPKWQEPVIHDMCLPPSSLYPQVGDEACEPALFEEMQDQAGASVQVSAGFSPLGMKGDGLGEMAVGEEETSPLVGLKLEEETRRAVEKWLRESPTTPEDGLPQEKASEGEEGSLPRWVLQELGEGEGESVDAPVGHRLVRVDSHGSSSNVLAVCKSSGQDCSTFKQCAEQAVSSRNGCDVVVNVFGQQEVASLQCVPDVSTYSSLGEQADEVHSCFSPLDESGAMDGSSSASWIKGLLGVHGGDAFEELEAVKTPVDPPAMLFLEEPLSLDSAWGDSGEGATVEKV